MAAALGFPIRRKLALSAVSAQPKRKVAVIGAALDLGAGRRGVDMGPSAIRYAGLATRIAELGYEYVDRGNVGTAVAEATTPGDEHARFLPQIKETCQHIAELVADAAGEGFIPIVLGGDHSVGLGTLGGLRQAHGPGGVIWIDADVAPGVGTPVRGGLSYREAHLVLELIAESGLASSLDVVEVNPILDRENETGKLAVELVASGLGARIL